MINNEKSLVERLRDAAGETTPSEPLDYGDYWNLCLDAADYIEELMSAMALVAAAEREACALLCEAEAEKWEGDGGPICAEARLCAVAIRARGTGKHSLPVAEEQEIGARGDA